MKLQTRYQGEIEVNKEDIIKFENGILGFPEEHEYFILPLHAGSPFCILQSINNKELAFIMVNPFTFYPEYEFEVPEYVLEKLEISELHDLIVYSIVTLQDSLETSTTNLLAPVIMSLKNKKAKQMVLNIDKYHTKHQLKLNKNQLSQGE